jgi:hypothetical protein
MAEPAVIQMPAPVATPSDSPGVAEAWEDFKRVLKRHFYEPDIDGALALYAGAAAHFIHGTPVWPMLVGPPGSMKTELLNGMDGLGTTHFIDQITAKTFISGQIQHHKSSTVPPGLLHRLGPHAILICADFSTILSMNRNDRASILSDLRRIYDGRLGKQYGTPGNPQWREWRGRITFLVGSTPDVDRHYGVFQALGERFVMIRWKRPGGVDAALRAMNQNRNAAKAEGKAAVHRLMKSLPPGVNPTLTPEFQEKIAAIGEFVVRGRTVVPRDRSKVILDLPEPESATRLPQQLAQLAKGSALIGGRSVADETDYAVARRVAFDCIPGVRRKVIDALITGGEYPLPHSTLTYVKEDLEALGLTDDDCFSELAEDLLRRGGVL